MTVAPSSKAENAGKGNGPTELPMPRDAHLLCQMSQALLQAARAGRVNRPSPPGEEETKIGCEDEEGAKDEGERVFLARRWQVVPRHLEGPEVEYLAKRRSVVRTASRNGVLGNGSAGPVLKRATVKRVDTEGATVIEEILVTEGQPIDGEVIAEVVVSESTVTAVEGVGAVNLDGAVVVNGSAQPTPTRRRPPPPKRKSKGPGRGRKKKVQFVPGGEGSQQGLVNAGNGDVPLAAAVVAHGSLDAEGMKAEGSSDTGKLSEGQEMEVGEDIIMLEDEGDEEEGEEGEDGDDDDREEGELSPSPDEDGSASPTKSVPAKSSSAMLQLTPSGLAHPLPPKPDPALFPSKAASVSVGPPNMQASDDSSLVDVSKTMTENVDKSLNVMMVEEAVVEEFPVPSPPSLSVVESAMKEETVTEVAALTTTEAVEVPLKDDDIADLAILESSEFTVEILSATLNEGATDQQA